MDFDVFNGDADGICALLQLRLAEPRVAQLVTGVKRDINLLARVEAGPGDRVSVLDISERQNHDALLRLLQAGAKVFYADHHAHAELPQHPRFANHINTDSAICTSLIVNDVVQQRFALWAVVGAFGDNLLGPARQLARQCGLDSARIAALEELGTLINYNGYGATLDDLHLTPQTLYKALLGFASPLDYLAAGHASFQRLQQGYASDYAQAQRITPEYQSESISVIRLPDADWSRRISGVLGNLLATAHSGRAHAIITPGKNAGVCTVSLRAPLQNPHHADSVAQQFPGGGGRERAAGINELSLAELPRLIEAMQQTWGKAR